MNIEVEITYKYRFYKMGIYTITSIVYNHIILFKELFLA